MNSIDRIIDSNSKLNTEILFPNDRMKRIVNDFICDRSGLHSDTNTFIHENYSKNAKDLLKGLTTSSDDFLEFLKNSFRNEELCMMFPFSVREIFVKAIDSIAKKIILTGGNKKEVNSYKWQLYEYMMQLRYSKNLEYENSDEFNNIELIYNKFKKPLLYFIENNAESSIELTKIICTFVLKILKEYLLLELGPSDLLKKTKFKISVPHLMRSLLFGLANIRENTLILFQRVDLFIKNFPELKYHEELNPLNDIETFVKNFKIKKFTLLNKLRNTKSNEILNNIIKLKNLLKDFTFCNTEINEKPIFGNTWMNHQIFLLMYEDIKSKCSDPKEKHCLDNYHKKIIKNIEINIQNKLGDWSLEELELSLKIQKERLKWFYFADTFIDSFSIHIEGFIIPALEKWLDSNRSIKVLCSSIDEKNSKLDQEKSFIEKVILKEDQNIDDQVKYVDGIPKKEKKKNTENIQKSISIEKKNEERKIENVIKESQQEEIKEKEISNNISLKEVKKVISKNQFSVEELTFLRGLTRKIESMDSSPARIALRQSLKHITDAIIVYRLLSKKGEFNIKRGSRIATSMVEACYYAAEQFLKYLYYKNEKLNEETPEFIDTHNLIILGKQAGLAEKDIPSCIKDNYLGGYWTRYLYNQKRGWENSDDVKLTPQLLTSLLNLYENPNNKEVTKIKTSLQLHLTQLCKFFRAHLPISNTEKKEIQELIQDEAEQLGVLLSPKEQMDKSFLDTLLKQCKELQGNVKGFHETHPIFDKFRQLEKVIIELTDDSVLLNQEIYCEELSLHLSSLFYRQYLVLKWMMQLVYELQTGIDCDENDLGVLCTQISWAETLKGEWLEFMKTHYFNINSWARYLFKYETILAIPQQILLQAELIRENWGLAVDYKFEGNNVETKLNFIEVKTEGLDYQEILKKTHLFFQKTMEFIEKQLLPELKSTIEKNK